uniref:NADPH-dependent diflavin oxidoreductase 1 n=1 Tax=Rhabditophanes sp. KR3021 TaxID=114890 RepID=A0AC35UAK6_9BILA
MPQILNIVYGSETGTAEDVATTIAFEGRLRNIQCKVASFEDFDMQLLKNKRQIVVFIISTSGQGEMPMAMRINWKKLLRKSLATNELENIDFAIFGLGDSSYQKYNFAAKKLYRRLLALGAKQILEPGYGDDQHELGIEGTLDNWKLKLWDELGISLGIDSSKMAPILPPRYKLDFDDLPNEADECKQKAPYTKVKVISNLRMTAGTHFQDTRLLKIDSNNHPELYYEPGDVLMVYAENTPESIEIAIEALNYDNDLLDKEFVPRKNSNLYEDLPSWFLGNRMTLRNCLTKYFDLQAIPKKGLCYRMAMYTSNQDHKERLLEFAGAAGLDEYIDYAIRPRRTVAELLRDFKESASSLDPAILFDLFSPIRPRAFSIASAPAVHKQFIEILVAKVQYKVIKMKTPRLGLCSTFISRLKEGDEIFVKIRKGTFSFPDHNTPCIMIGPGTGVAPFRSLLHQRSLTHKKEDLLFFGCRGPEFDDYFNKEYLGMEKTQVVCCYSRAPNIQKMYVQDGIRLFKKIVHDLFFNQNGYIFVAGSAGQMPKDVLEALKIVSQHINDKDDRFWEKMENQRRLQYETWS